MPSKKNKIPELLAPAGGHDQLMAAINFGADAVYLASEKFGMRAKATNFKVDKLKSEIEIAHNNNVKVYITANILMHDSDIQQLPEYFQCLKDANADGLIIGDMGAALVAKETVPDLPVHVSTQASVANFEAVKAWSLLNVKRIVLAREMSLQQITDLSQKISESCDPKINQIELEAFVHGAMCMSVSGRCLISSFLTDRSANKGECTQPCRWGFNTDINDKLKLYEEKRQGQEFSIEEDDYGSYIMNSKDMCMLPYLDKLVHSGVSSIKIEGRNKKALYVASVVNIYRNMLDTLRDAEDNKLFKKELPRWEEELNNVSHRPYHTGFYFGPALQSSSYDGYEQNRIHAADVIKCERIVEEAIIEERAPIEETSEKEEKETTSESSTTNIASLNSNKYKITVICRNRFDNNQEIEALIPKKPITKITVNNLKYKNKDIDIANRAKEEYTFLSKVEIPNGSFLRTIQFLRTSRVKK